MEKSYYLMIACGVVFIDLLLAFLTTKNDRKNNVFFIMALIFAALTEISYTTSIMVNDYFLMKIYTACFFSCVPIMLMFLCIHLVLYTGTKIEGYKKEIMWLFWFLTLLDVICEFINPFKEIVMQFSYNPKNVHIWGFIPQTLYNIHLILCYVLIGIIFFYMINRIIQTPKVYKSKYYTISAGLFIATFINAICIVFQNKGMLDYSQISYTVLGCIIYWDTFHSTQKRMLNSIRESIYDEFGHPIVLFGEEDNIAACNESIRFLVPDYQQGMKYSFQEFIDVWHFKPFIEDLDKDTYFRWYFSENDQNVIYRVDYRVIRDTKDRIVGRLFVFTDTSLEMDLLTQFQTKEAFEHNYRIQGNPNIQYPAHIVIFDINKLSKINKTEGEEIGDACILYLSKLIRGYFKRNSYYVRLNDANLMVVTHESEEQIRTIVQKIESKCEEGIDTLKGFKIQNAIGTLQSKDDDLLRIIQATQNTMKSRKLMDRSSSHSSLLDSFAQTLLESDETTKDHVERTRALGEKLGKRLSFTDYQMSSLSLLCLLHDVGKLGIPLEILNKPTKLTPEEMDVMKTHSEKGYRIASASEELADIADCILHHHERWDGKGYPDGLEKESIPLLSRVISVIDAYDAMTNDRPYHTAISDEEARVELKRCSGSQFDPYIVSEFLDMLDEIEPKEVKPEVVTSILSNYNPNPKESTNVKQLFVTEYELDSTSRVISIDDNFTDITGYEKEDLDKYQLKQTDLIPGEDIDVYMNLVGKTVFETGTGYIEHRLRRKDGFIRNVFCLGVRKFDVLSKSNHVRIIVIDAENTIAINAARKVARESAVRSENRWKEYLRKDSMTGILNHEAFINDIESELLKENRVFGFMIIDVDYFKQYNDSYGHMEGDQMLRLVANTLNQKVESIGFAGRLGGDEFAAFISIPNTENAHVFIKEQMQIIFDSIMANTTSSTKSATISMGGTIYNKSLKNFKVIYQKADDALYQSKEKGRKCLTINE